MAVEYFKLFHELPFHPIPELLRTLKDLIVPKPVEKKRNSTRALTDVQLSDAKIHEQNIWT